jgi:hypothetical protein
VSVTPWCPVCFEAPEPEGPWAYPGDYCADVHSADLQVRREGGHPDPGAPARHLSRLVAGLRTAAELTVQDVRAQRGDHIASLVEDSFAAHFERAARLADDDASP